MLLNSLTKNIDRAKVKLRAKVTLRAKMTLRAKVALCAKMTLRAKVSLRAKVLLCAKLSLRTKVTPVQKGRCAILTPTLENRIEIGIVVKLNCHVTI